MRPRWQAKVATVDHTDDWLMTYADMITLLLCFFAIFLSISITKKDAAPKVELAQPAPAQPAPVPVRQVIFLNGRLPFPDLERSDEATEPPPAAKTTPVDIAPDLEIVPPFEIAAAMPAAPEASDAAPKGDRITMLEFGSAAFFDSGSATLSLSGQSILSKVAADLGAGAFDDYRITVEGHTDDTPIKTAQFPSNWELSTARASAVVHFLLDHGIPAARLRAAGYADTFPKAPNRDAAGNALAENQAQNRRVVIKLEKIEKAETSATMR
jgi:chemotaxis protein MotB